MKRGEPKKSEPKAEEAQQQIDKLSIDEDAINEALRDTSKAQEDVEMSQEDDLPKKLTRKRKRPMDLLDDEPIYRRSPDKEEIEDVISQSNITNEPLATRISKDNSETKAFKSQAK